MSIQEVYELYSNLGKTRATPNEIITNIESELGLEFIGRGANRAVFRDSNHVYKVPISSTGKRQNTDSYNLYNELESNGEADLVADVLEIHEGVLKQKFCPVTKEDSDRQEVEQKLESSGYTYLDWDESSVGKDGKQSVLIDIAGLKV